MVTRLQTKVVLDVAVRRVMVREFDSVEQARLRRSLGREESNRQLLAVLRLACLLEESVLLTNAQLLDGVFFLDLGPAELARLLDCEGRALPFVVGLEAGMHDLAGALEQMRGRGEEFRWSSHTTLASADPLDLDRCLKAWLQYADQGLLRTTAYSRNAGDVALALEAVGAPAVLPRTVRQALEPAGGTPAVASWSRSTYVKHVEAGIADGSLTASEATIAYEWWNEAYSRALASSNDAIWITCTAQASASEEQLPERSRSWSPLPLLRLALGQLGGARESGLLVINGSLVDEMRRMPPGTYGLVSYRARGSVTRWRERPDQRSLNGVAFAVRELTDPIPAWGSVVQLSVLRTLVLVALAGYLVIAGLDTGVHGRVPLWSSLAAGFLISLPWQELSLLLRTRPGRLQAMVRLDA
jgi:hypothetical protein